MTCSRAGCFLPRVVPYGFLLQSIYTESLFLMLTIAGMTQPPANVIGWQRQRWLLAASTRNLGVLMWPLSWGVAQGTGLADAAHS